MSHETLLSGGLAILVGLFYGAVVFVVLRRAMREKGQRFMTIFLGGMAGRFVGLLLVVGLLVAFVPLRAGVFLGLLIPLLVLFMVLEVMFVMRYARNS